MKSRGLALICILTISASCGCTSYYEGSGKETQDEEADHQLRILDLRQPEEFAWGVYVYRSDRLEILADAGIPWFAYFLKWDETNPAEDEFDFSRLDEFLNKKEKLKLKAIMIVGVGYDYWVPDWIEGGIDNPKYTDYLARYLTALAEHANGEVEVWQLENELNQAALEIAITGKRKGDGWFNPERVKEVLARGAKALKSADPETPILVNANILPGWFAWSKRLVEEWDIEFDIFGLDYFPCYFLLHDPAWGDRAELFARLARTLKERVWFASTGYATYDECHTVEMQDEFLRKLAAAAKRAGASGLIWYELTERGEGYYNPCPAEFGEAELYPGLLYNDLSPKPAWFSLLALIDNDTTQSQHK